MSECLIITTGGTIDKPFKWQPEEAKGSRVPAAVKELGLSTGCFFFEFCAKDSYSLSRNDVQTLAEIVRETDAPYVVITGGSDRLAQISRKLEKLLEGTGKTVVFTGAKKPLSAGRDSDGYKNLQVALTGIIRRPSGVHVVMEGRWWSPQGLHKDLKTGEFSAADNHESFASRWLHWSRASGNRGR